jgi:hypothetical protein
MADELFTAGAGLLKGAADTATGQEAQIKDTGAKQGMQASSELGADRRQMSSQQAQIALEKLKNAEDQVTITPQIALGLVKNTGNKEWLSAIGTKMRSDMLLGIYTAESKRRYQPKLTQTYDKDGTVRHVLITPDEEGNPTEWYLDSGMNADKLHPGKGGKGGAGGDDTFKKNKEFLAQYNKRRAEYSDPIKAKEIQQTNPDKYGEDQQWLKDNMDQYDKLTRGMGKAGAQTPKTPAGTSGDSGANQGFDADAFIKEALGSGQ